MLFCDNCPDFDGRRCRRGLIHFTYPVFESIGTGQVIDRDEYYAILDDLQGRDRERYVAEWKRHVKRPGICRGD